VGEGAVSAGTLLDLLLRAPAARQPLLLRAIGALKARENIDRRIDELMGSTKDPGRKERLQRALDVEAVSVGTHRPEPAAAPSSPSASENDLSTDSRQGVRRLKLLDRRRS
jgi:hypothetical protein